MSANPQKNRTGLNRVWYAFGYSLSGLKAAWPKDTGSAAVLLGLLLCIAVWAAAIHANFSA
jgi:diacylglycerol kinase (ATP)